MWITVFKAGTHKNNAGIEQNYTEADLLDIANVYNNQSDEEKHTAPLIPGDHDKTIKFSDGQVMIKPSMGWVERLKVEGAKLLAKINPTPKFTEAVKGKYYNKLSISLKDNKLLDHIALLGSVNPAIKGLPNLDSAFTVGVSDLTELQYYEFAENQSDPATPPNNQTDENKNPKTNPEGKKMEVMTIDPNKLIEWLKSEFGDETATKVQEKLDEFKAEAPKSEAPPAGDNPPNPPAGDNSGSFSEEQKSKFAEQQAKIEALESKLRIAEFSEDVSKTNIPVGLKSSAINILEIAHNAATSNFSVKDEKGKVVTPVEAVKSFYQNWPAHVKTGEDKDVNGSNFSEPNIAKEIEEATKAYNEKRK